MAAGIFRSRLAAEIRVEAPAPRVLGAERLPPARPRPRQLFKQTLSNFEGGGEVSPKNNLRINERMIF